MFDPEVLQILGLNLMSQRSPNLGEALGNAGLATMQYQRQREEDKYRKEEREFLKQQREMQMAQAKRDARFEEARDALVPRYFAPGSPSLPYNDTLGDQPPEGMIPGAPARMDVEGYANALMGLGGQGLKESMAIRQALQKDTPFGKVDAKDFTPESIAKFSVTRNYADLVPVRKKETVDRGGSVEVVDLYAAAPGTLLPKTLSPADVQRLPLERARVGIDAARAQYEGIPVPGMSSAAGVPAPSALPPAPAGALPPPASSLSPKQQRELALDREKAKIKPTSTTEGERNAAGYLLRMSEASTIMDQLSGKYRGAELPSMTQTLANNKTPTIAPYVSSPPQQMYRQAQEDWVRAKLRKESGAVIADEEMAREIRVYFPQPGDSKDVIEQKRASRATAEKSMAESAGRRAAGASGSWGIERVN